MRLSICITIFFITSISFAQTNYVLLQPNKDEIFKYQSLGEIVSDKLMQTLKAELLNAIKDSGAVKALNVCKRKAIALTKTTAETNALIVDVKRSSDRYRNPLNKPDNLEEQVLKNFTEHWNEKPEHYLQKYSEGNQIYYRYYKPLVINNLCTTCHGSYEKMSDQLTTELKRLYPEDKAVGYENGDFRGVVRITFKEE